MSRAHTDRARFQTLDLRDDPQPVPAQGLPAAAPVRGPDRSADLTQALSQALADLSGTVRAAVQSGQYIVLRTDSDSTDLSIIARPADKDVAWSQYVANCAYCHAQNVRQAWIKPTRGYTPVHHMMPGSGDQCPAGVFTPPMPALADPARGRPALLGYLAAQRRARQNRVSSPSYGSDGIPQTVAVIDQILCVIEGNQFAALEVSIEQRENTFDFGFTGLFSPKQVRIAKITVDCTRPPHSRLLCILKNKNLMNLSIRQPDVESETLHINGYIIEHSIRYENNATIVHFTFREYTDANAPSRSSNRPAR